MLFFNAIMLKTIKRKLDPARYQGPGKTRQYFEGWYYKLVDKQELYKFAVIPGIYIGPNQKSHCFVQVFDGVSNQSHYFSFPITDFHASEHGFNIQLQSNSFSSDTLKLDLKNKSISLQGELVLTNRVLWPSTLLSPGIMGWYAWMPFMECYHGIVSLDHGLQGHLSINGEQTNFTGGKGYTEKDWGRSFPEAWIWCQSNHFRTGNTSLTGSIAIIPWIHRPFPGYIFGLWHQDKLYRFTTYTGARLTRFDLDHNKVTIELEQKQYRLGIVAYRTSGGYLQAPTLNGMSHRISETLSSSMEIILTRITKSGSEIILQDMGRHAGVETAGNLSRLLEMYNHRP